MDVGVRGANFGWPCHEGSGTTPGYECTSPGAADPLYTYPHDPVAGGSVIGGIFYNGVRYPEQYRDTFFFGDFVLDFIKRIVVDENDNLVSVEDFITDAGGPVDFFTGPDGDIYYLSIYTGEIRKIIHTEGNRQPIAKTSADRQSGLAPLTVAFSSLGSSDPDGDILSFAWDFGDGATSSEANPTHAYSANGTFIATLDVNDGNGGSDTDTLSITVGNVAPTATITNPPHNSTYLPGQTIPLFGHGYDPETSELPESVYSWRIILHHNTHIHILATAIGSETSFLAEGHGDPSESIYIEAELTVTDSAGLADVTSINLHQAPTPLVDPNLESIGVTPANPTVGTPQRL